MMTRFIEHIFFFWQGICILLHDSYQAIRKKVEKDRRYGHNAVVITVLEWLRGAVCNF